jgi:hypothetical protein
MRRQADDCSTEWLQRYTEERDRQRAEPVG